MHHLAICRLGYVSIWMVIAKNKQKLKVQGRKEFALSKISWLSTFLFFSFNQHIRKIYKLVCTWKWNLASKSFANRGLSINIFSWIDYWNITASICRECLLMIINGISIEIFNHENFTLFLIELIFINPIQNIIDMHFLQYFHKKAICKK